MEIFHEDTNQQMLKFNKKGTDMNCKINITLLLLLLSFAIQAQELTIAPAEYITNNQLTAEQTEDGVYYQITEAGHGSLPLSGDYVQVNYTGKLLDGTVFDQSEAGEPFVFQLGYRQVILGWELALPKIPVGSKVTLYVPAALGYGKNGAGKTVPPDATLVYEIEVLNILNLDEYDEYLENLERKQRQAFEQQQKDQFLADKKAINEYAIAHKLKVKRTASGLSYVLKKKGKGGTAVNGDVLKVYYEGRLLNDEVFDSNFGKSPYEVVLGQNKVIKGWEEGLSFFRKGSEGWLLIPSRMAYGPMSIEEEGISIPANSVLIFNIKVVEIDHGATSGK